MVISIERYETRNKRENMKNMPKLRFHLIFFYHKTEDWKYLFKEIGKVSILLYSRIPYNFIDKILILLLLIYAKDRTFSLGKLGVFSDVALPSLYIIYLKMSEEQ